MRNALGPALALALTCAPALADTFKDGGGTIAIGTVDVSRSAHAAVQCVLTVTNAATSLASLWSAAGCPAMPSAPQFAYVMPTNGGVYYRTDLTAVTMANGWPILQSQAWPIEGRLSISGDSGATSNGLQLIAAASVSVAVEIRW